MAIRIVPAIMSGGAGARLWPLSTDARPKQFHALGGPASLFTATVQRVLGAEGDVQFAAPIVLCNASHVELARQHLAQAGIAASAFVTEPMPRNTAAVGALAAAIAAEIEPGALVLLLAADHVIADAQGFRETVARAAPFARERIVTFGIAPDRPATGYGYIKRGAALGEGVFEIESFREKPHAELARTWLSEGGYSWNAGIFLFDPLLLLEEFKAAADVRDASLAALAAAHRQDDVIALDGDLFARVPSLPLDIAVMEKTTRAAVAPCDIGWADVGAWDEIWRLAPHDDAGNLVEGRVAALETSNSLLRAEGVTLCVAGVSDLVVVATPEAVIVLPRERAQDVKRLKELAAKLK